MANSSGAPNRPAHNAPVLVIGLGRFGSSTAEQLVKQGREVLAIERDRSLVQKWAPLLTHVVEADATNIDALRQLGAQEFSSAVLGVGCNPERGRDSLRRFTKARSQNRLGGNSWNST